MGVTLRKGFEKHDQDDQGESHLESDRTINIKDDIKLFVKFSIIVALVFVSITLNSSASLIVAIACCVWALFGPDRTIQAITLFAFVRFYNPALAASTADLGMISWVLLFISALKNIPWGVMNLGKQLMPILVFGFFAIFLSIVTSKALDISLLKIVSFLIGSLAIISIYNRMSIAQIRTVVIWLFSLMTVVVIFSLLVLPNKFIAYNLNGVGFQGVLNHPQTLGAFLAPLTAFVMAKFAFEENKTFSIKLIVIAVLIYLILITQARTAAVSVFLSLLTGAIFLGIVPIKAKIKSMGSFSFKLIGGGLALVLVIILYQPAQDTVMSFVFKRESENIDEALSSRAGGYAYQMGNFLKSPIIGHGFGVYPGPVPSKNVRYFMGIPISAAVEKGFLPTAILEEVGIVGGIAFIYLIVSLTRSVLRTKDPGFICLFFACLFINIGEAVFFAVGGMGVFYWSLIGLSTVIYKRDEVIK